MKRTDVTVGGTYVVLAPSQKVGGYRAGRKVTVLDTEPVWKDSYDSWSRREAKTVAVKNADGKAVKATDHVHRIPDKETSSYYTAAAKRGVLVVEESVDYDGEATGEYQRRVVPLANIRMTWSEYQAEVAAEKKARERRWANERKAQKAADNRRAAASALRDAMSTKLEGTPFTARILDGEVVLAGPFDALVELVEGSIR